MLSCSVADPGFPVGGVDLVEGHRLPRQLRFENFVYQNERICTLGGRVPGTPPRSNNAVSKGTEKCVLVNAIFNLISNMLSCIR